jgi:MoaD family protein
MEIRVYATLRPIVGSATIETAAGPGDSVQSLLDELVARWPDLTKELYDKDGALRNNIHVFVNGRDARYLGGLAMEIPNGAQIRIFPPVGGGH